MEKEKINQTEKTSNILQKGDNSQGCLWDQVP